jgi:hypothetical protein
MLNKYEPQKYALFALCHGGIGILNLYLVGVNGNYVKCESNYVNA